MTRFPLVDLLKGIAIILVIAIHSVCEARLILPFWAWCILELWVVIFITLMAFNAVNSWQKNSKLREYLSRRAKRLLPFFAIAWVFNLAAGFALGLKPVIGERQLVGFFVFPGAGNYFIPLVFQFVILFPVLYWFYRKSKWGSFVIFMGANLVLNILALPAISYGYKQFPIISNGGWASATLMYNLVHYLWLIWIGFWLAEKTWLRTQALSCGPLQWLGRHSYEIFLIQIIIFSDIVIG